MENNTGVFSDLTICSVYHSDVSWRALELNNKLTHDLNRDLKLAWIAVDNSHGVAQPHNDVRTFKVVQGMEANDLKDIPPHLHDSFNHAFALNKVRALIKSRYALILDNDFFIVRPNWVKDVLGHMREKNLALFGSTWHPKYFSKYRYFPSVHCLFIDREKIDMNTLDFRPILEKLREQAELGTISKFASHIPWPIKRLFLTWGDRKLIGGGMPDTGHRIYEKYASDPLIKYECLQSVFKPKDSFSRRTHYVLFWPNFWFEKLLPDRWCLIPKKSGYYTMSGFKEQGLFDVSRLGWEEYLWKNEAFGIHMRSNRKRDHLKAKRDLGTEVLKIEEVLKRIAEVQLSHGR